MLATLDAAGVAWVPPSPGTVAIPDSQIQRWPIVPTSLSPVNGRGTAFAVQLPVPAEFAGQTVLMRFDLFDNQNQAMSLGWYSGLQLIAVPEPHAWALLGLGFLLCHLSKRNWNR